MPDVLAMSVAWNSLTKESHMPGRQSRRWTAAAAIAVSLIPSAAFAAGTNMPWEGPLDQIVQSMTGPVAKGLGVLAIVSVGFGFAFSEGGGTLRRILGIVLGLSIAFAAAQFGLTFFGFAGGLTL
jgi:type IV secretion system protein VirB2